MKNPENYLQQASAYNLYDALAWEERQEPAAVVSVTRDRYVYELEPIDEPRQYPLKINYIDGLSRTLETKVQTRDHQNNIRYVASGLTVYNNKGRAVEQYLSFYSDTADYDGADQAKTLAGAAPTKLYYDPAGRIIRRETSQGLIQTTGYSPWHQKVFDENDAILDSPYYAAVQRGSITLDEEQQAALDKSLLFANTPNIQILDSLGRAFMQMVIHKEAGDAQEDIRVSRAVFDIRGRPVREYDPRLNALEAPIANFTRIYDMRPGKGTPPLQSRSVDAGLRLHLHNQRGSVTCQWDSRQLTISHTYDNIGRPVGRHVQGNDGRGLLLDNQIEQWFYGEFEQNASLHNLAGQVIQIYDSAGILEKTCFDIAGQSLEHCRKFLKDYSREPDWTNPHQNEALLERQRYATTLHYNANGALLRQTSADGSVENNRYNQLGQLIGVSVLHPDQTEPRHYVTAVEYDAQGQRTRIEYGNGIETRYDYEVDTLRLSRLFSRRLRNGNVKQDLN